MTWPTVAVSTTNVDAGTDSPATARTDILDALTKQNQMIAHPSSFMQGHLADTTAAAARTTLGAATAGPLAASGITGAQPAGSYAAPATTLAGYGISDGVNTTGAQTVGGKKSFTTPVDAASLGGTGTGNLTQYTTATTPLASSGTSYIGNHSLGVIPVEVVLEFTCLVAEKGYAVGDVVQIFQAWNGSVITVFSLWKTTTQCGVWNQSGCQMLFMNKAADGSSTATPGNWSYRFRMRAA